MLAPGNPPRKQLKERQKKLEANQDKYEHTAAKQSNDCCAKIGFIKTPRSVGLSCKPCF